MLKRAFDIFFSAGTLLVLTVPLLAIAIWVKLDSPGPVFFRQRRVGLRGREFEIYKFRTMRAEAQGCGPQITIGQDPRITHCGAFLRKYKIDEIPQFINALIGDMSIVGPRPEVPRYVALYPRDVRDVVLSVRPGITDLASIEYRDENELLGRSANPEQTYVNEILPAKLAYCQRYVNERSFLADLDIVRRSFVSAFARR